ncbi:MAG: sulfotransferase [Acidobacteriota bacterium]
MIFIVYASTNRQTAPFELGLADYSYHFVLETFLPVLERLGTVVRITEDPEIRVDAVYDVASSSGESCLFLSFTPPHKTLIHLRCPTVCVFAWEYRDLPRTVRGDMRDDWAFVLRSLGGAITHSEQTAGLIRGTLGDDFPVAVLKAPLFEDFAHPPEDPAPPPWLGRQVFDVRGHIDEAPRAGSIASRPIRGAPRHDPTDYSGTATWKPHGARYRFELEGIVYLSVFNPTDGRKNWPQIVECFALALGDRPDATLVLKTVRVGPHVQVRSQFRRVLESLGPLRCRIVLLDGFLDDETYRRLLRGATYGVNASRGEGQCLPLMESMSAGRPAVAPPHTGMADYLDPSNAFCVGSSLEPASFPHDPTGRLETWRHRVDAHQLFGAFRESYRVATEEPERYRSMSERARSSLERHASRDACERALRSFLETRGEVGLSRSGVRDTRADIERAFRQQLVRLHVSNRRRRNPAAVPPAPPGPVAGVPVQFILAGFAKCGTTSLSALLGTHPDLYIRQEENWHFAGGLGGNPRYFSDFFARATPGQRLGLCGVTYGSQRDAATARDSILYHYPDIRLMFIARDPLARIESAYRENHHTWHRTAARLPPFDVSAALEQNPVLVEDCRYGARLAHYSERLRPDRIHVLFFEDLIRDPAAALRDCYRFLGVDVSVPVPSSPPRLNPGDAKLRDTEALRAMLDVENDSHLAMALRVLSLEERDQLAVPLGLREPHPDELPGWDRDAQRRFAGAVEDDVRGFLEAHGRSLDLWPRFAELCGDGPRGAT